MIVDDFDFVHEFDRLPGEEIRDLRHEIRHFVEAL